MQHSSLAAAILFSFPAVLPAAVDLSRAAVVVRPGDRSLPERTAATVLVEEVEKRTGIRMPVAETAPAGRPAIFLSGAPQADAPRAEGFRIVTEDRAGSPSVRIDGASPRGALFGVGALLRYARLSRGSFLLDAPLQLNTSPAYPIRGHQLGYRTTANSWDAWTVAQFEQHIRDLALFGANSIENIPFQDDRPLPLMKVPRREMNRAISEICLRYGLDYWVWTPADFDLNDTAKRNALLARFDELFADSPTLSGVFVPGGDPGDNPPALVFALMQDIAKRMKPRHPGAKLWLSLQGFDAAKEDETYRIIETTRPDWLGGLVAGPSSPSVARTRRRLPARYGLRLYPDLTHNKICQYQVPSWDQAYALTLGREAINPRPAEFAEIHNRWAAYSDGFLSYSDGVHDDVNKAVWTMRAWDPSVPVRDILLQYASFFFGPGIAPRAADAILALERNWRGPLAANGAVDATLLLWEGLERDAPALAANWRWQMCVLRAVYDAYVRRKLLYETDLEREANAILARDSESAETRMTKAVAVLQQAVNSPARPDLRQRIIDLCARLFASIGLQTSVEKYQASGAERGAILDFVDVPLNNRWWLEDEFQKVRALPSEAAKNARLLELARWEDPGPGSFYDDIGHEAHSPRAEGDAEQDPDSFRGPEPMFWWWDNGRSRARLSWQTTMWPRRIVYEGLDPQAVYTVRTGGYGKSLLRIDGVSVTPSLEDPGPGAFKEFRVAPEHLLDRRLVLTWDIPKDEDDLNWRRRSRLAEVWLLRK